MNESNVVELKAPTEDVLGELLKEGARQLLAQAIEAEVAEFLIQYADQTVNGKRAVVRNGHLPERSIQTGLGDVPVKVPKVRDRSGGGRAAAGQPRLLSIQRITDHAALHRGGALVRDETAAHRFHRAGEEVQAHHAPPQQQAGAAGECAAAAEVILAGGRFSLAAMQKIGIALCRGEDIQS